MLHVWAREFKFAVDYAADIADDYIMFHNVLAASPSQAYAAANIPLQAKIRNASPLIFRLCGREDGGQCRSNPENRELLPIFAGIPVWQ